MTARVEEHQVNIEEQQREHSRRLLRLREAKPGEERDTAQRMFDESKIRGVELARQTLDIIREQRTVEIDGARQRLQLMRDQLTIVQKQRRGSRDEKKSLFERLGQMDPIQARAVMEAEERVRKGIGTRADKELVANDGSAAGRQAVTAENIRLGRERIEENIRGGGRFGEQEIGQEISARTNERDRRNRLNKGVQREQERLGSGVEIAATVDNKFTFNIKEDDNYYTNAINKFKDAVAMTLNDRDAKLQPLLEEAMNEKINQHVAEAIAKLNQQGRNLAGGGGLP